MDKRLHILLVDDDEEEYLLLKEMISGHSEEPAAQKYDLDWVGTYEEALDTFSACQYDLYLVDYHLGSRSGLDLVREPVARKCAAPIIILTGRSSYEADLSAMQVGAADYLEKGEVTFPLLDRSIRYAIDRKQVEQYLESLLQERAHDVAQLRRQAQEINALQKATSTLLNTLDPSILMSQILDAAQEAIPAAERSWLHLVEDSSRLKTLKGTTFVDPRIRKIRAPADYDDSLKPVYEGHAVLIPETGSDSVLQSLLKNEKDRRHIQSAVIAPLILSDEVFGTLSLSASRPAAFSDADLRLLTSFAATATAALHNAILYAETQNLAATDPLTGQLNRRTFLELGQREMDRFRRFGHPLSALMFDVDNFKSINDTFGHSTGDQVLLGIVGRCCRVIRHVDVLGRYGGDEFAILLPETGEKVAREVAERIRNSIAEYPIVTEAGPIPVTISMGVTEAAPGTTALSVVIDRADQALYQSKQAGRNRITLAA